MKRRAWLITLLLLFLAVGILPLRTSADSSSLLSPEENLWLKSRNGTIVVYPLENDPPYSYKNSAGNPEGLAIDYLQLIAQKIDANIQYLTPRPLSQAESDMQNGKGDILASTTPDDNQSQFLIFTDNYLSSPSVIVVRKDSQYKSGLTLNDFNGKQVAVVQGSALESYMRVNYPKVVIEETTDNEVALQQVVLGADDAAVMDVASLSYYLSKQVLSSVKVVGDTGFDYKPAFGVQKNLPILQSILEKGLSQISSNDRATLNSKWVNLPVPSPDSSMLADLGNNTNVLTLYVVFGLGVIIVIILLLRRRDFAARMVRRPRSREALTEEVTLLEKSNSLLSEELKDIKAEEDRLEKKLDELTKEPPPPPAAS